MDTAKSDDTIALSPTRGKSNPASVPNTRPVNEQPKSRNSSGSTGSALSGGSGARQDESRILLQQMSGQIPTGPVILAFLQGTDHLFVKKCKQFPTELFTFKPMIKREIWNSSCRTIYYAGQTSSKWSGSGWKFIYQVVDYSGRVVLAVQGVQTGPGIKSNATITLGDGTIIGTITQECCDASYTILDSNNKLVFKIQGPCYGTCTPCVFWCCEEHFELNMSDGVTEIGLITTHWKETHPEARGTFGLSFPIKMETQDKALLLGAAFLIHYQYYRTGGNGLWVCILILAVIVLVGILGHLQFGWFT